MIDTMTTLEDREVEEECYFAEDQTWDEETLKELRDEYHIYFMTNGDGVVPVKVLENGSLAFGIEDDGTICFTKIYGSYVNKVHLYWLKDFIKDLQAAEKGYMENLLAKTVENG